MHLSIIAFDEGKIKSISNKYERFKKRFFFDCKVRIHTASLDNCSQLFIQKDFN